MGSLHVTFDDFKFPGAPRLAKYLKNEADSNDTIEYGDYGPDSTSVSEGSAEKYVNVATVVRTFSHERLMMI